MYNVITIHDHLKRISDCITYKALSYNLWALDLSIGPKFIIPAFFMKSNLCIPC